MGKDLKVYLAHEVQAVVNNSHEYKYLKLLDDSVRFPGALQAIVSHLLHGCEEL